MAYLSSSLKQTVFRCFFFCVSGMSLSTPEIHRRIKASRLRGKRITTDKQIPFRMNYDLFLKGKMNERIVRWIASFSPVLSKLLCSSTMQSHSARKNRKWHYALPSPPVFPTVLSHSSGWAPTVEAEEQREGEKKKKKIQKGN
jgi:hypothetical protein